MCVGWFGHLVVTLAFDPHPRYKHAPGSFEHPGGWRLEGEDWRISIAHSEHKRKAEVGPSEAIPCSLKGKLPRPDLEDSKG